MPEKHALRNTTLVGLNDVKRPPISGWQEFLKEGKQFLATADKAFTIKREAFNTEILYNLVAMAIEKLIMARLLKSGNLPYNHTMHDLVESMEEFLPGDLKDLGEELKALDAFQEICDLENYTIVAPTETEVARMIDLGRRVAELVQTQTSQ